VLITLWLVGWRTHPKTSLTRRRQVESGRCFLADCMVKYL
jgi:hypothetical protein